MIISRRETENLRKKAKENKEVHYFTGLPCKYGHISTRLTSTGQCDTCKKIDVKKYRVDNEERVRELGRIHYWKNRDSILANPKNKTIKRRWADNNRELIKARRRADRSIRCSRERARKLQAIPKWVNKEEINKIYTLSKEMTKNSDIVYNVDHIVPLKGKYVCGLHVEYNLQIIPFMENVVKGNKYGEEI